MADIGSLALKLSADPGSFESGLMHAEGAAGEFGKQIGVMSGNVLKAFDAIKAHPVGFAISALVTVLLALKSATSGAVDELKSMVADGDKAAAAQGSLEKKFGMTADAA